jgi:hypothetical protein
MPNQIIVCLILLLKAEKTLQKKIVQKKKRVMLHIIPLSSFFLPKIDVALKITIKFLIYHSWILIK